MLFPCTPLVYFSGALCSFFIYILLFTEQKKKKKKNKQRNYSRGFTLPSTKFSPLIFLLLPPPLLPTNTVANKGIFYCVSVM